MPKFKVVNPDAPEEIDFYQDIPLVDPDTGMDQLDSDGNILVKRYVNHTVSIKGITEVKNALPAIKTNTRNLEELYQYSHAQNEAQQVTINENSSAIVDLQTSASDMALELETLKNKINGIQGIDIDDLKDYVNTQIPLIKNSYLPLTGGTITGNLTIEEGTITGSLTGTASNATADVNNKALTSYIADIMGANAQLSIIKGDGTTSVLSINNVLNATKATNADNATNLGGYPATDYVRSVNGINADENGNVQLGNLVKSVNGVKASANGNVTLPLPFVKTVNSTAPDSNGNVVLNLSSSGGGVGFPNLSAGVAISNFNGTHTKPTTRIYTLPSSGWVVGKLVISKNDPPSIISVYLNTTSLQSVSAGEKVFYEIFLPLKSGTQIKLQIRLSDPHFPVMTVNVSSTLRFYPFLS